MKKALLVSLSFVLVAAMAIGMTVAYLTDTDSDVNVMTMGNVSIAQHEYERVQNADGSYETKTIDNATSYVLKDFTQAKPLYPATEIDANGNPYNYGAGDYDATRVKMSQVGSHGSMDVFVNKNAQDKFVTVENTGKTDAYVRTVIAMEIGSLTEAEFENVIKTSSFMTDQGVWKVTDIGIVEIGGNNYYVSEYLYNGAKALGGVHENGVLPAGDTTYPSLAQVYMTGSATNEDVIALDGNNNGTYDILVLSQAVQTAGFENAATALETAFGKTADEVVNWFNGTQIPEVFSYEGVNYIEDGNAATVTSAGGTTVYRGVLSDGKSNVTAVTIDEGITHLNNRALCKAPALTQVNLPSTLTYIDESAFQQSGITSIEVPENVTYIGKQAFGACGNLETIVINAKNVTIANYVARACANLKEVYIYSDSVTFESGSMYFTNKENADASGITFYVGSQDIADTLYNAFSTSHSYGLLIKSLDGTTTYYNTLK